MDKRDDRRGDGRPKSGLEQPSGPPRLRGRRRGLRRVGDSRPGRGDRGDKLEKDAGLRAPGTRRGESWQADRNNVWSLRAESIVDCECRPPLRKWGAARPICPREDCSDESYCQASEAPTSPAVLRQAREQGQQSRQRWCFPEPQTRPLILSLALGRSQQPFVVRRAELGGSTWSQ